MPTRTFLAGMELGAATASRGAALTASGAFTSTEYDPQYGRALLALRHLCRSARGKRWTGRSPRPISIWYSPEPLEPRSRPSQGAAGVVAAVLKDDGITST
jgi:hypothetical protein